MTRLQKKHWVFKAGITPFLSLIFILLLSLVGAMFQSISIQTTKSVRRAEMSLAVENIFAEYQVELLEKYNIFARKGTNEKEIVKRLEFYGVEQAEQEILGVVLLSDLKGEAFYQQAIGTSGEEQKTIDISTDVFKEAQSEIVEGKLNQILSDENAELPVENNPIEVIKDMKKWGVLSFVCSNQEMLSNRSIILESLPSHRILEEGNENLIKQTNEYAGEKLLFVRYLSEHFSNICKNSAHNSVAYELEYLLGGYASDKENLAFVAEKILGIRMGINYGYLLTDETKKLEAETVAVGLSSLLAAPEASEIIKQAILLAWAYGESIVDVRLLLQGEKIPVIKSSETWQLGLANIFRLKDGEVPCEKDFSEGITYEEYIKALLLIEEKEILCMRALDLIEINTGVKVDQCLTGIRIKSICALKRKITYTFQTEYQYR